MSAVLSAVGLAEAEGRGPKGRPNVRVDYIFVSAPNHDVCMVREELLFKQGLPKTNGTGRFWLSDHVALLHEYAVAPRSALAALPAPPAVQAP